MTSWVWPWRAALTGLLLLGILPCAAAHADAPLGLRSVVRVPANLPCVASESLIAQVRAWLRDAPVDAPLVVEVDEGLADGAEFVSYRVLRAGELVATRKLSPAPPSCAAREAALALAIALALRATLIHDLESLLRPPHPRLRADLAARVGRSYGVLPSPAWGGELAFALTGKRLIGGALALGVRRAAAIALGGGELGVGLYTLGAQACARTPDMGRLVAGLCVGGAGGFARLSGVGYATNQARTVGYASALAGASLGAALGKGLTLELHGAATALLTPIRAAAIDDAGVLHGRAFSPLGGELGLGFRYVLFTR